MDYVYQCIVLNQCRFPLTEKKIMAEKKQMKAVEMVRRIRDEQAQMLAGESKAGFRLPPIGVNLVNITPPFCKGGLGGCKATHRKSP
jgi:hypothetical protein